MPHTPPPSPPSAHLPSPGEGHLHRLTRELAAARAATQAKSNLLARVSHEVRTPLTAILGFADMLATDDRTTATSERATNIDAIRRAGRHALALVNDLLDHAKIEAGRLTIESLDTPLAPLLADLDLFFSRRATDKGLSLVTTFTTPLPDRILTDPTRLRQILINLLANAIRFTHRGHIHIALSAAHAPNGPRLHIDVRDTGPGIDAHTAARLFAPFEQADASTARTHGGTGLGLAISRDLARLMGGDITLTPTDAATGACFHVDLPLTPAPGARLIAPPHTRGSTLPTAPPHAPATTLSARILLAEDDPDNQRLITLHLRAAGAEVVIAPNGRIALDTLLRARAAGRPFDLLLTDMQMPEMDGPALARALRSRGCNLPIIALTANAMAQDRARCLAAGCNDYAIKPIDRAALVATCAKWIGVRSPAAHPAAARPSLAA